MTSAIEARYLWRTPSAGLSAFSREAPSAAATSCRSAPQIAHEPGDGLLAGLDPADEAVTSREWRLGARHAVDARAIRRS